ncbi:hypothetical protein YH67_11445 [Stenotrophomonas maltophilia]|nr:hypothetical protein YH67_11445 [Stenotrophomonas maltophilia]ALA90810.1 hypothetical protein YH68_11445 [Stenotrophomonas maltophilia]KPG79789.1 hypothetical protein AN993_11605 [Stenotrophomonas maltophilia]MBA0241487.1 hypothetical protein [Stenotrophomonas maltophilia]MBA0438054.1 hypothetical protein [Stenotrophomonas maltophilia]
MFGSCIEIRPHGGGRFDIGQVGRTMACDRVSQWASLLQGKTDRLVAMLHQVAASLIDAQGFRVTEEPQQRCCGRTARMRGVPGRGWQKRISSGVVSAREVRTCKGAFDQQLGTCTCQIGVRFTLTAAPRLP